MHKKLKKAMAISLSTALLLTSSGSIYALEEVVNHEIKSSKVTKEGETPDNVIIKDDGLRGAINKALKYSEDRNEPFTAAEIGTVTSISRGVNSTKVKSFEGIENFINLEIININGSSELGVGSLIPLAKLPNLRILTIHENVGTIDIDELLNSNGDNHTTMTTLGLRRSEVKSYKNISKFPNLQNLMLTGVGDSSIEDITKDVGNLSKLTNLSFFNDNMNNEGLKNISKLPKLNYLQIDNNKTNSLDLRNILVDDASSPDGKKDHSSIVTFALRDCNIESFEGVEKFKILESFQLINNENPLSLAPFEKVNSGKLQMLYLQADDKNKPTISDKNLNSLGHISSLKRIFANSNGLESLDGLEKIKGLTYLQFEDNEISDIKALDGFTTFSMLYYEEIV